MNNQRARAAIVSGVIIHTPKPNYRLFRRILVDKDAHNIPDFGKYASWNPNNSIKTGANLIFHSILVAHLE